MIPFIKVRDVKSPCRAHPTDAGIDFFVPEDVGCILLYPHERACIPSGIIIQVPLGYALIAFNKSGISSQLGLCKLAEVIDFGYRGEVHISIVNTSNEPIKIRRGQKIIQFILVKIGNLIPFEVPKFEENIIAERGGGGFGSTGF